MSHVLDFPNGILARLPAFLQAQRWYGEKAALIESLELVDWGISGDVGHLIVNVSPESQAPAQYYVPVLAEELEQIADAAPHPAFHRLLASLHEHESSIRLNSGRLVWRRTHGGPNDAAALSRPSRSLGVDQSNSSIQFGDVALVKVLRRVQPGANPEVELTRFLTERTDFRNSPALLGWLSYVPDRGKEVALAVAQSFAPSISDGWTATLADLSELTAADSHDRTSVAARSHDRLRRLGQRTAELHLALASDPLTAALAPEWISEADLTRWRDGFIALLDRIAVSLRRATPLDERAADLREGFLESLPQLAGRVAGFEQLLGLAKTRVHGDYHLGQTLLTRDGDWFILDFEGEPRRSLEERRAKTSPLKDVAGMLRSFSYARGAAEQASQSASFAADLIDWERWARATFLDGYLAAAHAGEAGFLPSSAEEIRLALSAWELDKAIYEIDYELNNRPDWLWLPLSAALKFA